MTVTLFASGSTLADGSEQFLSSPNVVGKFSIEFDLNIMQAGDVLEVRAYKMVLTGGTQRLLWYWAFYDAQPAVNQIVMSSQILNDLTDTNSVRFSMKQTFGTNRTYPWKVFNEDATADTVKWNGTAVSSPATAGIPDVNVKNMNNVAATSITTVNANQGTTQPVNFTGTAASALVKVDTVDIAGATVSTSSAQIGTNVVSYAAGQAPLQPTVAARTLDVSATGEAGLDWANIGAPTTAVDLSGTTIKNVDNAIANVTTVATTTNLTNAPTNGDFTGVMKTSLNAATPASVTGAVGSVTGNVGGNVTGSVGSVAGNVTGSVASVTGNVGGNVVGTVGSVVGAVGSVTGNVGGNVNGNVVGSVASVTADVGITQAGADKVWNTASRTLTAFGFSVTLTAGGVQAIWDALTANLTTANSIGKRLVDFVTTLVYSAPPTSADNADAVWDELMAGHVIPGSAGADLTTAAGGGSAPTVQQIVDGVWDEAIANHLDAGSTGEALSNAGGGGGDPWATVVPDGYAQGTAGYNQGLIPTIEAQTSLITAENVKVVNPVNLITLELTLYNSMDYSTSSGTALPTWTSDDWTAYGLQTAASVTLYYADVNSDTDTALGSIVVDSATSIHFEAARSAVMALTLGEAIAGYKIIAVLDHAHGDSEVVLVNAALSHLNYSLYRNKSQPNTAA